ncbi:ComF family protein [Maritimibacter sp. UBA3975]|uniref:ComF family protein n=1 Tax=Maritimibacter sp. UBA3975 TaxID=1946833 RepID=UPI000C0A35E4|nr:ComF family protein [Maritimibacter sp. UBA3975]MAM63454.1 amidophosphoribosyltransferase [Maritimibacter sp.]|tara:strand:+ start:26889 stop:27605 length:717 start_codon:yes stop_codon:yes gene_type:complete
MQSLLRAIYPAQCASCGEIVEGDGGLCGPCWRDTRFVTGHVCDKCGVGLPGEGDGALDLCDDCMTIARPWSRGRTAFAYSGKGRRLVLALKHSDRPDIAIPAARWIAQAARPLLSTGMVIVPVPSHWTRLFRRRYNQAAEISRALGRETGLSVFPNALVRLKGGETQGGKTHDQRFANVQGNIEPHPKHGCALDRRNVLIVDDVMTSGATLAATCDAAFLAGASDVCVATLARVARDT